MQPGKKFENFQKNWRLTFSKLNKYDKLYKFIQVIWYKDNLYNIRMENALGQVFLVQENLLLMTSKT